MSVRAENAAFERTTNLYVDGQKLAIIMTKNQVAMAGGPSQGSAAFDPAALPCRSTTHTRGVDPWTLRRFVTALRQ